MQVYKIDNNGFYIEPVILSANENAPNDCIEIQPPQGLYRAKWTGTEWIEDMSQEEIEALNNQPKEPTENEILRDYVLGIDYRLIMMELGL